MDKIEIVDLDLVQQLKNLQKSSLPQTKIAIRELEQTQKKRNAERQEIAELTPIERRRKSIQKKINQRDTDNLNEDLRYLHSVLALCGLPYKRPKDDSQPYEKKYGKNSLLVQPGFLKDPETGDMIQYGVPYGPKARLMLIHICSESLAQNSAVVQIEPNMTAFIRRLGFKQPRGGIRGEIKPFKEQLNRLAACRMAIGLWDGAGQAKTIKTDPIDSFDVHFPRSPEQYSLWASEIHLNPKFFNTLKEHAIPIDIRALSAFTQSARQMDIIWWLSYRTRNLSKNYPLKWSIMHEQFGQPSTPLSHFRRKFIEDLEAIRSVYPKTPIRITEKSLILTPCDPEHLFVPQRKVLR